jgi:hypothetical protein
MLRTRGSSHLRRPPIDGRQPVSRLVSEDVRLATKRPREGLERRAPLVCIAARSRLCIHRRPQRRLIRLGLFATEGLTRSGCGVPRLASCLQIAELSG